MADTSRLFMKLTKKASGDMINGEAVVTEFKNQIELEDWNWNLGRDKSDGSLARTAVAARGAEQLGSVTPSPLAISKYMDRSTPSILSAMVADELLTAQITLEEAADVEFALVIDLSNVRVLNYEVDGDVEDKSGQVKERWTLNYEEIKFHYSLPGQQGKATVELMRDPDASTDMPDTPDLAEFKKYALRLGSKKAALAELEKISWDDAQAASKPQVDKKTTKGN